MEDKSQISDGYHTFGELYKHRYLLFINYCLMNAKKCWWNRNGDYEGYFCLYCDLPYSDIYNQISYHIPDEFLYIIKDIIPFKEMEFDGHTSNVVADRLLANANAVALMLKLRKLEQEL
jgi:hypothetical protein